MLDFRLVAASGLASDIPLASIAGRTIEYDQSGGGGENVTETLRFFCDSYFAASEICGDLNAFFSQARDKKKSFIEARSTALNADMRSAVLDGNAYISRLGPLAWRIECQLQRKNYWEGSNEIAINLNRNTIHANPSAGQFNHACATQAIAGGLPTPIKLSMTLDALASRVRIGLANAGAANSGWGGSMVGSGAFFIGSGVSVSGTTLVCSLFQSPVKIASYTLDKSIFSGLYPDSGAGMMHCSGVSPGALVRMDIDGQPSSSWEAIGNGLNTIRSFFGFEKRGYAMRNKTLDIWAMHPNGSGNSMAISHVYLSPNNARVYGFSAGIGNLLDDPSENQPCLIDGSGEWVSGVAFSGDPIMAQPRGFPLLIMNQSRANAADGAVAGINLSYRRREAHLNGG